MNSPRSETHTPGLSTLNAQHPAHSLDLTRPTLVVGAFLALHVLLPFIHPAWGGDLLAYHPAWVQGLFILAGLLLLLPAIRRRLLDGMARTPAALDP